MFFNTSTAANANLTADTNSYIVFRDFSTAGNAAIANQNGGETDFADSSSAGNASISIGAVGGVGFHDTSSAGSANITNNFIARFLDSSTAANAVITNVGGGTTVFANSSTAGSATIIVGSYEAAFLDNSNGGSARFVIADPRGAVDFSFTSGPSGMHRLTAGSIEGAGTYFLGANQLTVGSNNLSTIVTGSIGDGGGGGGTGSSIVKVGTGTLTLTGINTYSGGTTISAGILHVGTDSNLGASAGGLTFDGGALQLGANVNLGSSRVIFLNSGGGAIDTGGFSTTVSQGIGGPGSFTKVGAGTVTLSGTNTYTGGTVVTAGTLQLGGSLSSSGSLTINGGTFDLGGRVQTVGALSGTGGTIIGNQGFLTTNSNVNTTLAASIVGADQLIKAGTGTLTLTGNSNFFADPGIVISAGAVQIGNGGTSGSIGGNITDNATLIFNRSDTATFGGRIGGSGTIQQAGTGTLILTGFSNNFTGTTIISAGTLQIGDGSAGPYLSGNFVNNSNLAFDLNGPSAVGGVISGSGTVSQIGGTTTLSAANTYSGGTIVNAGTLQLGAGGSLLPTGSLTVNGGIFSLNGQNQTVGALSGSGGAINLTNATLTTNSASDTVLASQFIALINAGALVKMGTGKLTLTGDSIVGSGTTIAAGTLEIGNGGTTGSLFSNITNNSVLIFNRSNVSVFRGIISGSGSVTKAGAGTLVLAANSSYTGGTTVAAGILQLGSGGTTGMISGDVVNNGGLAFVRSDTVSFGGVISGTGLLVQAGLGTLVLTGNNSYSGGTTILSGTLVVGNGATAGSISGNVIDNGTLSFNRSDNITFGGVISGTGSVTKTAAGILTLTGANTYAGGTTISNGTLIVGNGATAGSITGDVANNSALAFNRSDNLTFANVISGAGTVAQNGSGALTFSGINTYTGATTVSAGTLNITGTIASSSVNVASGATLSGTGKVGATSVAGGGTLNPGSSTTSGTLSVSGNLSLASGSNYLDAVTPTASALTSVSGSASINGNFIASLASGAYTPGRRYTVLTASGGVSGTFASSSTSGIPTYVKGRLSYDANNVYLNLDPNALAPSLTNATTNQRNAVAAIDAAVFAGATPTGGFLTLYGLSSPALNSAVDQIYGQIGPNVINAVGQSFLSFLSMASQGGSGDSANFAPGSAYGTADAPHRAQLGAGEMRVWGAAYGGHVGLSADAVSGAASLSSNNVGMIGGADMQLADGLIAGATFGLGRQMFSSGNGSGDSNDFMLGLYARLHAGQAYVAASLGYGWHQIKTLRVVTVSGTDVLQGKQNADDFGGRIEAGWRMALDEAYGVAPYAAFAGESFDSPAYGETALSGASTFAVSYAAHTSTLGRSELGAHLDRGYELDHGVLTADLSAAWAHQLDDHPFTQASFLGLPGAAFQVAGVRPDRDAALLGFDLQVQNSSGLFFGVRGEGQFGTGTTLVEGMGNFGWRW